MTVRHFRLILMNITTTIENRRKLRIFAWQGKFWPPFAKKFTLPWEQVFFYCEALSIDYGTSKKVAIAKHRQAHITVHINKLISWKKSRLLEIMSLLIFFFNPHYNTSFTGDNNKNSLIVFQLQEVFFSNVLLSQSQLVW